MEIIQAEGQRENYIKIKKQAKPQKILDNIRLSRMNVTGVPKVEKKMWEQKKLKK